MNLNLLKVALQNLVDNNIQADEARNALAEIDDISRLLANDKYDDPWNGSCYVLHADDVDQLLNTATYDMYGELYAAGDASFDKYAARCRLFYNYLSTSVLQLGHDVISQLYADNEANGCHDHDGTFLVNK